MTSVQLIADAKVVAFLQSASLESLPAWKRGVLEASSRSTNDTPRATSEISKAMTRARNTLSGKTVDQLNQLGLNRYRANESREPFTRGRMTMPNATNEQSITLLIKPGTATANDIAELLYEIGKLYRLVGGGGGLTWQVSSSPNEGALEIRGIPK